MAKMGRVMALTSVNGSAVGVSTFDTTLNMHLTGTAPQEELVMQSMWRPNGLNPPGHLKDLFDPPYQKHLARVHSKSWESCWNNQHPNQRYTTRADEIDTFVWANKDMVICFAAGNRTEYTTTASVWAEAAAKNCTTVGASENERPNEKITYNGMGMSNVPANIGSECIPRHRSHVAAFSARGPVCRPRDASNPTSLRQARVALIKNQPHKHSTPSAALIKALLVNGTEIPPPYTKRGYSDASGFGLVNLANSIAIACGDQCTGTLDELYYKLDNAANKAFSAKIPQAGHKGLNLKVTLVWSDPPGVDIRNRLQLQVVRGVPTNPKDSKRSPSSFNNVQQVLWENVAPQEEFTFFMCKNYRQSRRISAAFCCCVETLLEWKVSLSLFFFRLAQNAVLSISSALLLLPGSSIENLQLRITSE